MANDNSARSARQAKIDAAAPKKSRTTPIIAGLIVAVVLIGVVWAVIAGMNSDPGSEAEGEYPVPAAAEGPTGGIQATTGTLAEGAPRLDVYEDPQCGACAYAENVLGDEIASLRESGGAQVVYHVKTFMDDNYNNDVSMRTGNAMMCAADATKFNEYHDAYWDMVNAGTEVQTITDIQLGQLAEQAGLQGTELEQWNSCTSEATYTDYLDAVEDKTSREDGVTGTPTFRINGEDFPFTQQTTPESLRAAVESASGAQPSAPASN